MAGSARILLHEYRTTFLWWLLLLFIGIGCFAVTPSTVLPHFLWDNLFDNGAPKTDLFIAIGLGGCMGLGLPILGLLLVLFVPAITPSLDPVRRVGVVEWRRPRWKSAKAYALALVLKPGEEIRLEQSATTETSEREQAAARARALLQPCLS